MDPLTSNQNERYKKSKMCHICFRPFTLKEPKVRDHCHYTGNYRGAVHRNCNLQYKIPSYIPIAFHNLAGHDAHLFIRELAASGGSKMDVFAKNKVDYITFSIRVAADKYIDKNGAEKDKEIELRFIDSFKFMSSSFDSLTNNLVRGGKKLFGFEKYTPKQYELLVKKGIYPYEYMSEWEKFKETKLPPKEAFYSKLNMSGVSFENYEFARKVWEEFKIKNLGEYHDLYLKTDVILLANVFEAFREVCSKNYGLDPANFCTASGLAWKACLKKTKIRLELSLDPDMLLMFERGIRGGIIQSVHRWAKANNPYMGSKFNSNEKVNYLQYLDANNLYGWAMSQPLPTGGFKWTKVKPEEISKLAKLKNKGYLLEVDVKYPKELHDSHNDLLFMCKKLKINGVEKFVPKLFDKKKYVIHIRALDQDLKYGLVLEKSIEPSNLINLIG